MAPSDTVAWPLLGPIHSRVLAEITTIMSIPGHIRAYTFHLYVLTQYNLNVRRSKVRRTVPIFLLGKLRQEKLSCSPKGKKLNL